METPQAIAQYETIIDDLLAQHYSVVSDFFSEEEVAQLRQSLHDKLAHNEFKKSGIGAAHAHQIATEVRGDFIFWLNENETTAAEELFFNKINALIHYLNRTCYLGIQATEFHYALYPKGTFYKRHLDTFQNDSRRKLSIVCYLNEENWHANYGGALAIYTSKEDKEEVVKILPEQGKLVIFESQLLEHEVETVTQPRMSITGWLKTGR